MTMMTALMIIVIILMTVDDVFFTMEVMETVTTISK